MLSANVFYLTGDIQLGVKNILQKGLLLLSNLHKTKNKEDKKIKSQDQRDLQGFINDTAIGIALIFAIGALMYSIGSLII